MRAIRERLCAAPFWLWLAQVSGLAAAYYVTGRFALLLAIPPGYATAIWPAAGIALTGILLCGYRVWPGIVVGSFFVNVWTSFDATNAGTIAKALALATSIGLGAALQAVMGAFLVRKSVGFPNPLIKEADIGRFLLLGGPVGCLLSPTWGVTSLLVGGVITWTHYPFSWATWWIGDTIGVLVATPLLLTLTGKPREVWQRRRISGVIPQCLTLMVVVVFFVLAQGWEAQRIRLEFERQTRTFVRNLQIKLDDYVGVLHALESFYASSGEVDRREFQAFVRPFLLRYPGIRALSWNPRLPDKHRAVLELSGQRDGYPDFQITEQNAQGQLARAAKRPYYVSVFYIEPYERNKPALGFDVASNPTRREALNRARDTGRPAPTSWVKLVQQSDDQPGILVFLPIYSRDLPLNDTVEERQQNLKGYVGEAFQINDVLTAARKFAPLDGIELTLYDETAPLDRRLLYSDHPQTQGRAAVSSDARQSGEPPGLQWTTSVNLAGQRWAVSLTPTVDYFATRATWHAWAVLASGLLLSLLGTFPLLLTDRNVRTEELVVERTAALSRVNAELNGEIVERKRAEGLFRLVVDSAPNGMLMIDHKGKIVLLNSQIENLFGYDKRELLGLPIEMLVPARFRGEHPGHRRDFFGAPQARPMGGGRDLFGLRKDGSEFPVEIGLNPIGTPDGPQVLASVIDITERKRAEERLRQSEERFRSVIENVKDHAIFMLDTEGCVLTWNKGATRVRGYHSEEIIGKHYSIFFTAEDRESGKPEQLMKQALAESQWEDEGWRVRKDGSRYWSSGIITAVHDGGGGLVGFLEVTSDLSRHKRVEDELMLAKEEAESANQAKSDFLANISHEIRTPMTGIIGMAGLLLDTKLSPKQREYGEIIRRSSETLLTVINEVLDFSKVESGKLELEVIDFDLRSAVAEVMELFEKQAEDKGVQLISFVRFDVPTALQGDPGRLRQILSNLVSNALKFTASGEVVVAVTVTEQSPTDANLRFTVTDTGIGIPKDKLNILFNSFTQVDVSTTRKYGGTGLGLAICKKFVELMGGRIGVDSEQGKGSSFWFTLHLLKQREGIRETRRPRTNLHGLRMLIVEGNSTISTVLDHYLTSLGIRSQSAEDGPTALELLRTAAETGEPYDLVILDLMLPGMDGLKLARTIRLNPKFSFLKLLLLTSVGKRGDGKLAREAGVDGYLIKPVSFDSLFESLALLMGETPESGSSNSLITRHSLVELKAQRRLRVLVADDNHVNQKVTASLLEKMGHRADVVGDGKEALEAFKLVPYDVVLMDLQMPEMDGVEASRQIRRLEQDHHTPIIAVTAHARKEDKEKCLAAGMDDYISKPINPQELKAVIARTATGAKTTPSAGHAPEPPSGTDVFNLPEALAQVEGNTKLLREITRLFLEQLPELLEESRQALSRSDYQSLGKIAHTLASSVGQLAAHRAFAAAKKLEEVGGQEDSSRVPEALAELERELLLLKSTVSDPAHFSRHSSATRASLH